MSRIDPYERGNLSAKLRLNTCDGDPENGGSMSGTVEQWNSLISEPPPFFVLVFIYYFENTQ